VNDNDISQKYFQQTNNEVAIRQQLRILEASKLESDNVEGNELIQKLRQQSIDNAEQNNLIIQRKTFENDQVRVRKYIPVHNIIHIIIII
jgi:uncharacterized protein Smg (DUF494 family)